MLPSTESRTPYRNGREPGALHPSRPALPQVSRPPAQNGRQHEQTQVDGYGEEVLAFRVGETTVLANLGSDPVELPTGLEVLLATVPVRHILPPDATVWLG